MSDRGPGACPAMMDLERQLDGEPAEGEIALHVAGCAACRAVVEEIRANNALFGKIASAEYAWRGSAAGGGDRARVDAPLPVIQGYEIEREIGRGGQGVVYRAVQSATRRPVALKVLLAGAFATSRQRRRFEREVELVASLDHPNVVAVYDSGTAPEGRHWLAMRWVEGEPLDVWLAARRERGELSRSEVLRLFRAICAGVTAAHQRGVIHRDLKPANVLVDRDGVPYVLDFGLAKPIDEEASARSVVSVEGSFLGTLAYASPEQARGDGSAIDTRSDVYSLGVILYEMLTGRLPHSIDGDLADVLGRISRDDPRPPKINGEIDAIVLRALAKEKDRRYQSAAALGADVENYLAGLPIDARRDSTWYVLSKTLRRHRVPVVVAAAFLVLLVAFPIVLAIKNARIRLEAEKLRQINVFLEDTIGSVESGTSGGDVTVRELLDEAVQWIDLALEGQPEVASSIQVTVGNGYRGLGLHDRAEPLLLASLETRRALDGDHEIEIAQSLNALGLLRRDQVRYEDAESLLREALEIRRRRLGDESIEVAYALANLALLRRQTGDLVSARTLLEESLAIRRAMFGHEHQDVAMCLHQLGETAEIAGDNAGAERLLREALAMRERLLDERHPDLARSLYALGNLLVRCNRPAEAVPLFERCLSLRADAHHSDDAGTRAAAARRPAEQ